MSPWRIPESWSWCPIGDVTTIVGGGTPSTTEPKFWEGGTIPWLTPADLSGYAAMRLGSGSRFITPDGLQGSGATMLPTGTVLMSSRAPVGYAAIAAQPLSTNQGFKSFTPTPALLPEYLYYFILGNRRLLLDRSSGTTFQEISGRAAATIPVPVAPVNEQRRIVAAIEEHLSRLDAAVHGLKRVQALIQQYRAAVLKVAFEGRLLPGVASGGSWPMRRVRELGSVQLGKMLSQKSRSGVGGRPYLRNKNVRWMRIESDDLLEMDFSEREVEKYSLVPGDVLVCEGGEPGRAAVWRLDRPGMMYQKALHRVRLDQSCMLPEFFAYQMWDLASNGVLAKDFTGSTIQHLPLEDILELTLTTPPISVQSEIVREIERCSSLAGAVDREVQTGLARAAALRASILKRAFEGKLVSQDSRDELANILLERIRASRPMRSTRPRKSRRSA